MYKAFENWGILAILDGFDRVQIWPKLIEVMTTDLWALLMFLKVCLVGDFIRLFFMRWTLKIIRNKLINTCQSEYGNTPRSPEIGSKNKSKETNTIITYGINSDWQQYK